MDESPRAILVAKDTRDPKVKGREVVSTTNLGLPLLYLVDAGEIGGHMLPDSVDSSHVAVPKAGGGELKPLRHLLPSTHGRAKGIGDNYVISMREHRLGRLRISSSEFRQGRVILLNC
jgi:hypothetical protein